MGRFAQLRSMFEITAYIGKTVCIVRRARNRTLLYSGIDLVSLNFVP